MFQSTHPLRGATLRLLILVYIWSFNPRTPCEVRRNALLEAVAMPFSFNPRTPCEVRPARVFASLMVLWFQSTHPLRGATQVG